MVDADVSTVSKHLALLRNAGIVQDEKRGAKKATVFCVLVVAMATILGTALPVLVFSGLIAVGARSLGVAFNKVSAFAQWARWITGAVFVLVGIYLSLVYIYGVL